jgi:hypothetical protein
MKIKRIIQHLSTRRTAAGTIHWGFRVTRTSDGKQVEGKITGGGSNISAALTNNGKEWVNDTFSVYNTVSASEIISLPYAGCCPDDIRAWVKEQVKLKLKERRKA